MSRSIEGLFLFGINSSDSVLQPLGKSDHVDNPKNNNNNKNGSNMDYGHTHNDSSNNNDQIIQEMRQQLQEKEVETKRLQDRLNSLSAQLAEALQNPQGRSFSNSNNSNNGSSNSKGTPQLPQQKQKRQKNQPYLSPLAFTVSEVNPGSPRGNGRRIFSTHRERLGRSASIATQQVLQNLLQQQSQQREERPPALQRIHKMFQSPLQHANYLNSEIFAKDVLKLAGKLKTQMEREPRVVFLQSPCYVFGDIHGNLEDLHFFSDNLWRLGMSLTAGNFLFLGDYVDRGMSGLECVAYLFAMKYDLPSKVFLLRGNHETRDVNGWEEHYGERSFIYQCRQRFGDDLGYRVWEACNQVFDRLPLAAVIDQDIFCVHGGIPRSIHPQTTRIQDILTVPKVAGINPPYEHEDDQYQQVASDCIWSDPASDDQEMTSVHPDTGFGDSLRGGGAICFGHKAVTDFLEQQQYTYILRAHEAHAEGVAVSKGARVFTVFSTSQDHNQGSRAMAGCMLVDNDKLQVINRSPAYKNQYIHRRDSVSVASLSEVEIEKRIKLGLVKAATAEESNDEEETVEVWEDFLEDDSDSNGNKEDLIFDTKRRPSVDLTSMTDNYHDTTSVSQAESASWESDANSINFEPTTSSNKRRRSRRSTVEPIIEEVIIDPDADGENDSGSD